MDYKSFSELNLARCESPDGYNLKDMNPLFFTTALAEEVGEVCGVIKKLERGFNARERLKVIKTLSLGMNENDVFQIPSDYVLESIWKNKLLLKLEEEMADVFTYFDLFASKMGINWKEAVYKKFDKCTEEMNLPIKYLTNSNTEI